MAGRQGEETFTQQIDVLLGTVQFLHCLQCNVQKISSEKKIKKHTGLGGMRFRPF